MIKTYYYLTKPGIIMGNVVTTAGGFALASRGTFDPWLFLATLVGLALVIGSAGVFNNYLDREIDRKMDRTKHRALAQGLISGRNALYFGSILVVLGILLLVLYTNWLTAAIALFGFLTYVILYGILKRRTVHGTLIGSIAGAVPPVIGYCAVSNRLDIAAWILFLIMVLWQMPHFFAIAIYRLQDYTAASIPVLPVVRGSHVAKIHMLFYTIAFLMATLLLTFFGYTGNLYLVVALLLGLGWIGLSIWGFSCKNDTQWARHMFRYSLLVIMGVFAFMAID